MHDDDDDVPDFHGLNLAGFGFDVGEVTTPNGVEEVATGIVRCLWRGGKGGKVVIHNKQRSFVAAVPYSIVGHVFNGNEREVFANITIRKNGDVSLRKIFFMPWTDFKR